MSKVNVVTKFEVGSEIRNEYRDEVGAAERVEVLASHFRGLGYDVSRAAGGYEVRSSADKVLRGTLRVEVQE